MSEQMWIERAQSAEARLKTLEDAIGPMKERIQNFKMNFGVKEGSDGSITIDFEKFAKNLGLENAMELRKVIDEVYRVTGEAGQKPHIKLAV